MQLDADCFDWHSERLLSKPVLHVFATYASFWSEQNQEMLTADQLNMSHHSDAVTGHAIDSKIADLQEQVTNHLLVKNLRLFIDRWPCLGSFTLWLMDTICRRRSGFQAILLVSWFWRSAASFPPSPANMEAPKRPTKVYVATNYQVRSEQTWSRLGLGDPWRLQIIPLASACLATLPI